MIPAINSRIEAQRILERRLPVKTILANYIVRIYRFEKNKPSGLVGVVEEAGLKEKKAFTNLCELWDILSSSQGVKNGRRIFRKK